MFLNKIFSKQKFAPIFDLKKYRELTTTQNTVTGTRQLLTRRPLCYLAGLPLIRLSYFLFVTLHDGRVVSVNANFGLCMFQKD